jgi:DNA-binding winged helix-turn-helix (wHTH) protein
MSHLSLAFLGAPQVHHAGRMLTFRTRKALGLLVYLTVAGGMHSREKLTALLWPESDQEQGRASLRNTLVYLRNALSETSDSPHLITERDALGFDFSSAFELDIHTLQTAFKQAHTHARAEGLEARMRRTLLSHLQDAVEQYRGDFLQGFSLDDTPDFDDRMRRGRATWHQRMSSVLDRISQLQFPASALTLLVAGAVLGHAFTFEQVCQVAGIGEQEGLLALDALLVSQYLSESKDLEREAYFFTHDKIRDVAYTEAGEARRRVFHRRALDVSATAAAPPAELAHHARASGLVEPTFHWSLAAGDAAMRLFAVRDAIASPTCVLWRYSRSFKASSTSRPSICKRQHDLQKRSVCQGSAGRFKRR